METRTYYFPANQIGHYILNCIVDRVSCSIGDIRKVSNNLAVVFTTTPPNMIAIERILQTYDLI